MMGQPRKMTQFFFHRIQKKINVLVPGRFAIGVRIRNGGITPLFRFYICDPTTAHGATSTGGSVAADDGVAAGRALFCRRRGRAAEHPGVTCSHDGST